MAHFLRSNELPFTPKSITKPIIGAMCRLETIDGNDVLYIVHEWPLRLIRKDVPIAPIPDRVRLIGLAGETIQVTHKFWVTLETVNPYHLVIDIASP